MKRDDQDMHHETNQSNVNSEWVSDELSGCWQWHIQSPSHHQSLNNMRGNMVICPFLGRLHVGITCPTNVYGPILFGCIVFIYYCSTIPPKFPLPIISKKKIVPSNQIKKKKVSEQDEIDRCLLLDLKL